MVKFEYVVFAGGGGRCLWQAGFWAVAQPALNIKPKAVACVSAGATIACMSIAGQAHDGLRFFKKSTSKNPKNVYIANLFKQQQVFPQYQMYRELILNSFDQDKLSQLQNGPEIRVMIVRPPRQLGPKPATLLGFATYFAEKKIAYPMHPAWGAKVGFKPEFHIANHCQNPEDLADLLLSSSCTPPFLPVMYWKKKAALDGGLVDNVPVMGIHEAKGNILVLLSRQYPVAHIPDVKRRLYVQPSEPISIKKWDYTDPDGLQKAFDQGRKDGERFVRSMESRSPGTMS